MTKAVFLDRDGVLNKELGHYTTHVNELEVLNHAISACKKLKEEGYLLVVITNQGGIAKGIYSHKQLKEIHDEICIKIPEIDFVYYCPHHDLITKCLCRKPLGLMLEKAIYNHKIDVKNSFMIGDSDRDILAAESVGVKGIKINPNEYWDVNIFK